MYFGVSEVFSPLAVELAKKMGADYRINPAFGSHCAWFGKLSSCDSGFRFLASGFRASIVSGSRFSAPTLARLPFGFEPDTGPVT